MLGTRYHGSRNRCGSCCHEPRAPAKETDVNEMAILLNGKGQDHSTDNLYSGGLTKSTRSGMHKEVERTPISGGHTV